MEPFIGKKFVTLDEGHITNERGYTNFKSLITEDFIWTNVSSFGKILELLCIYTFDQQANRDRAIGCKRATISDFQTVK